MRGMLRDSTPFDHVSLLPNLQSTYLEAFDDLAALLVLLKGAKLIRKLGQNQINLLGRILAIERNNPITSLSAKEEEPSEDRKSVV